MKKKSVLINEFSHKELAKLTQAFGSQYGDLVEAMILYFKKTGINPHEAKNENPSAMIKMLDKRIVSFMKVQERDILKPLRTEIYENNVEAEKRIETLFLQYDGIDILVKGLSTYNQEVVKKLNSVDLTRTNKIIKAYKENTIEVSKLKEAIVVIGGLVDNKNKTGLVTQLKDFLK